METNMAIIELRDFSFTYAGAHVAALSSISLDIDGGEFVLVCGKSGCGKTTLLRNLKKEIAPQGTRVGDVRICGLEELTPRQSATLVGFVMQDPDNQIVTDSVWSELAFGLENLGIPPQEIGRRIGEISAFFGIDSWFGKKVSELSGGQKQMLSLAAVIAMQAEIIVLDEPTAQLDPIAAKEFLHMLARVNTELGKTVVISEHSLEEALAISDKVLFMDGGEVKYYGDARGFVSLLSPKNETRNDYYFALPAPTRLAIRIDAQPFSIPLDVREGRQWLLHYPELRTLHSSCECVKGASDGVEISSLRGASATKQSIFVESSGLLRSARNDESVMQNFSRNLTHRESAIKIRDIWFRYSTQDDFVLKGLDAEIVENEIHIFVGGNGSGKSTLLRVLAGVRKPFRGKVRAADGKTIAMLAQDSKSVFVRDTLREDLSDHNPKITGAESDALIARLGLSDLLDRHPYDLSAGEMQKAALAKILLLDPDILLLDEPTKGIDALARAEVGRIIRELRDAGKTIALVTHDIEFAAAYGDTCSMLFAGGIIAEGSAHEFFNNNMFYTTSINRMTRGLVEDCVLEEDVRT
jgi:energy-coupling factor transport system ATP-binding protein